jgi:hypothetical protein
MLEAGAATAMHLDGGGSSEMLITKPGYDGLELANYPSGGFERRLINALGLYVQTPPGAIEGLYIDTLSDTVITGVPTKADVYGLDAYYRKIEIPPELIQITGDGKAGYADGHFTAYESGRHTITASYGGHTASITVYATDIYELRPNVTSIKSSVGGKTRLTFTGVGQNGTVFDIDPAAVSVAVHPEALGEMINGEFMPVAMGAGFIRCSVGRVDAYIPVYATIIAREIDPLNGAHPMGFSYYPDTVYGSAAYVKRPDYFQQVVLLAYHFDAGEFTQAAYADFSGITSADAKGFRLSVLGDLSGNWLRGQVTDAAGEKHLIDFARVINWEGWKDVEAWLPEGIPYPVTLDRVYVASTAAETEILSQLYFCNLRGLYDMTAEYPVITPPESHVFKDALWVDFYDWTEYGYDITFMADATAPAEGAALYKAVNDVFLFNAAVGMYLGQYGENYKTENQYVLGLNKTVLVEYKPEYAIYGAENLSIIQMTAAASGNSGLMFADKSQWAKITASINASYTNNIMIMTDISPRNFSNKKEFDLLHELLRGFVRAGKNVFVLSKGPGGADISVIDGVRYFTLGSLYQNGEPNAEFAVLRFRITGEDIRYSVEKPAEALVD